MTLERTAALIDQATAHDRPVAAFNVVQLEHAQGIVAGAERVGLPVILQLSENTIGYHGGPRAIARGMREVAESAGVPVALHLDHLTRPELCARTADLGFSSFMIDAAGLPYAQNVEVTARTVAMAAADRLWVESELGEVGGKGAHQSGARTAPDEAAAFVEATGIHGLAIAIGSSHAMREKTATLDLDLLARIEAAVDVPLVLHGSSGVRDDDLVAATRRGIRKVNIGTQLNDAFTGAVVSTIRQQPGVSDPRVFVGVGRAAIADRVERVLDLLAAGLRRERP
ncbi:class II fructose-bisphosphate aldolase [Microbacterium paraoxydans]|uniref:class II fructose-bisphosphate aldolase n=1 Tax=Microbacterium paraoxydans TaxID=199592 RepID=UPI000467FA9A|nr:class II fructose-bisphosphate aldolase [Microbacterium paraoxydans]